MTSKQINEYIFNTPLNTNPAILNQFLQEYVNSINFFYKEANLTKIEDYLYTINYNNIDYKAGADYFKKFNSLLGGCSSVRKGNFYGRNYDWYYDNSVTFVIHVPSSNGRHESIGVANMSAMDKAFVEKATWNELYEVLPNLTLDGINDAHVVCNINVVPSGDYGFTTGTSGKDKLCALQMCRFILDNADSADDAIEKLSTKSIWMPKNGDSVQELHLMIADEEKTYIVEFINNKMIVLDQFNFMTNFYLYGTELNEDGSVYTPATQTENANAMLTNHITKFGCGLERFNIINSEINNIQDADDMIALMKSLYYSQAYVENPDENSWYTELVEARGLTCASQVEDYLPVMEIFYQMFIHRSRDNKVTWQTVHSSVYDIENLAINMCAQEKNNWHEFQFEEN